ncbi:MAG: hypothetical protein IPK82_04240 [Polyangiaceae bacterium]|nr:hypothetical protein [Polyangiaceae bacterium]
MKPAVDVQREPNRRLFRAILFVASAAAAALILRGTWAEPRIAAVILSAVLAVFFVRWVAQKRLKRALLSGDVNAVLRQWSKHIERAPHASTMAPLMTATAFAANGFLEHARTALAAAERGPAWEAALEHRLFLDTFLLTFEGDRDEAVRSADRLARLPVLTNSESLRARVVLLRSAVGAFARAFAHKAEQGDLDLLETAAQSSPLVHWAMRYAGAVVAIDRGDAAKAQQLILGAPNWPTESAFRSYHDEIALHVG